MPNPDTSISSIYAGIGCGIVIIMRYMCIFIFNTSSISTTTHTLIIIPIVAFIFSAITNFISQALKCNDIDSTKALLGSLPAIGTTLIGMLIAYFDKCRIPIVSIIAPYYQTNFTDTKCKSSFCLAQNVCDWHIMYINFWSDTKNLDRHKTFWVL